MFDKKGAISATMTWVVATIVILFVVIFFIYSSYVVAKEKEVLNFELLVLKFKTSGVDAEQVMLALLQTEFGGISVKEHILNGEYSVVENNVNLVLDKLEFSGKAEVYVGNKKVVLDSGSLEVK